VADQIHDPASASNIAQFRVVAGYAGIENNDVVIRRPADAQCPAGRWWRRGRLWPGALRRQDSGGVPGCCAGARVGGRRAWRALAGLGDRAAQQRPVSRMAEPGLAVPVDFDPCHPLACGIGAVGAAVVYQHPSAALRLEHGMMPGDAVIGEHDVALRIAADQV
jgi:hypothetical protein